MAELRVVEDHAHTGVGAALIRTQWRELLRRYGVPDDREARDDLLAEQLAPPTGVFLVGWLDDDAVACGGVRRRDEVTGEIKRMFVAPEHRRRGFAQAILRALEERARALGYTELVLETGIKQPEAIALYEREGYRSIEPYGYYRDAPGSRCYGKSLV